jgi:hypothetical protein
MIAYSIFPGISVSAEIKIASTSLCHNDFPSSFNFAENNKMQTQYAGN